MHAPSHQSSGAAAASNPKHGADHIAPDCAGQNFYAIDRGLRDLLRLYLQPDDFSRLEPHFDRLGRLSGGRLDELARVADKHHVVFDDRVARQPLLRVAGLVEREALRAVTRPPISGKSPIAAIAVNDLPEPLSPPTRVFSTSKVTLRIGENIASR